MVSKPEVVDPIVLGVNVLENVNDCCCCCCCAQDIPETIANTLNGNLAYDGDDEGRYLAVSLGIFSIVRIVRPGQFLITASEYIIPDKECISPANDDPCSVFRSMAFPVSEFTCGATGANQGGGDRNPVGKCGC